jgi:hypothetical protein
MPNLHESVVYCKTCDHYVAVIEVSPCAECGKPICPGCAKPTKDPDLSVCSSYPCGTALHRRLKKEAA